MVLWPYNRPYQIITSFDALGHVFFGTNIGVLYCLNMSDGEGVWKTDIGAPILTPATYRDGKVYLGSHDDHMYCVDASDGSPIWDFPTGMDISTAALVLRREAGCTGLQVMATSTI